jgi:hypothetical protein
MKKTVVVLLCAALLVLSVSTLGAQATGDLVLFDASAYFGWGNTSMTLPDGTQAFPGLDVPSVPTCIETNLTWLAPLGPFSAGFRWDVLSGDYITGFGKGDLGIQHDQWIVESAVDAIAGVTAVSWLFPYVFAGGTAASYSLFDPNHMPEGQEERVLGLRAGGGVMVMPFEIALGGGSRLRFLGGPEAITGVYFLTNYLYTFWRIDLRATAQLVL